MNESMSADLARAEKPTAETRMNTALSKLSVREQELDDLINTLWSFSARLTDVGPRKAKEKYDTPDTACGRLEYCVTLLTEDVSELQNLTEHLETII
jgi:hypothetical protein